MPLSWEALQTAVRTWVSGASGLPGGSVIWANQNGNKLPGSFVTLRFGDLIPVGAVDEKRWSYNAGTGVFTETVVGQRAVTLTVQCFTRTTTTGSSTARAILGRVQLALRLSDTRAALNAAGLSPFDLGTVQEVSTVLDADFEGRAVLPVRFYVAETLTANATWIQTVQAQGYTGVGGDPGTQDEIDI